MVVSTNEINGKTVRVWQESRGKKTLEKTFYVLFYVYVIVDDEKGYRRARKAFNTQAEAANALKSWREKVSSKRNDQDWLNNNRTPYTHVDEIGFWQLGGKGYSYKGWVLPEGGELINQRIF